MLHHYSVRFSDKNRKIFEGRDSPSGHPFHGVQDHEWYSILGRDPDSLRPRKVLEIDWGSLTDGDNCELAFVSADGSADLSTLIQWHNSFPWPGNAPTDQSPVTLPPVLGRSRFRRLAVEAAECLNSDIPSIGQPNEYLELQWLRFLYSTLRPKPKKYGDLVVQTIGNAFSASVDAIGLYLRRHDESGEIRITDLSGEIIEALYEMKATAPASRKTAAEIAKKISKSQSADSLKSLIKNLKDVGIVGSKSGAKGGTWLTEAGVQYVVNSKEK